MIDNVCVYLQQLGGQLTFYPRSSTSNLPSTTTTSCSTASRTRTSGETEGAGPAAPKKSQSVEASPSCGSSTHGTQQQQQQPHHSTRPREWRDEERNRRHWEMSKESVSGSTRGGGHSTGRGGTTASNGPNISKKNGRQNNGEKKVQEGSGQTSGTPRKTGQASDSLCSFFYVFVLLVTVALEIELEEESEENRKS